MAKALVFVAWFLLLPLMLVYQWYGPGEKQIEIDKVGQEVRNAQRELDNENWKEASEKLTAVISKMPKEKVHEIYRLRLEKNKALMKASGLPKAHRDLTEMVEELTEKVGDSPTKKQKELLADSKFALANANFFMTWLARREGHARDVWLPYAETARQTFTELEENATNGVEKKLYSEELEKTIRLSRLDLKQLLGLPIPNQ